MDEEPLSDEYDAAADGIPSAALEGPSPTNLSTFILAGLILFV